MVVPYRAGLHGFPSVSLEPVPSWQGAPAPICDERPDGGLPLRFWSLHQPNYKMLVVEHHRIG